MWEGLSMYPAAIIQLWVDEGRVEAQKRFANRTPCLGDKLVQEIESTMTSRLQELNVW